MGPRRQEIGAGSLTTPAPEYENQKINSEVAHQMVDELLEYPLSKDIDYEAPVGSNPDLSSSKFIIIYKSKELGINISFADKDRVNQIVNENGPDKILRYMPNANPELWPTDVYLILAGNIVVPKPRVVYDFEIV